MHSVYASVSTDIGLGLSLRFWFFFLAHERQYRIWQEAYDG